MKTTNEQKPQRARIELVFVGKCVTTDKKPGWEFREFDDKLTLGDTRVWSKIKGVKMPSLPGVIYSVEIEGEKSSEGRLTIYPSTFRFERQWPDEKKRMEWQAIARADDDARAARSMAKRELADANELTKTLDKLGLAYAHVAYVNRPAFLAMCMRRIMYGRAKLGGEGDES